MCGIAGVLNLAGAFPERAMVEIARRMADKIAHRGPDDHGVWIDPSAYCALSQRRLSIIDLSPAGHQPMVYREGIAAVTFNGEIYNYEEVREELKREGCVFSTRTDTEVLLQAVLTWGEKALIKFDGMFAFAFYRSDTQELLLGRDPFGEKPLYYTLHPDFFAFSSELHSLPLVPGFDATIDEDAIGEYIMLQYVQAPRSIYRSARKLPPGQYLKVSRSGKVDQGQYFQFKPGVEEYKHRPLAELADELGQLLTKSIKRRMISDVPLGAFISGGVDSSTVVAIMAKELGAEVKSFSIGFKDTPDSEHHNARQMAEHLGCRHHEQVLDPDILSLARSIGVMLDEPNGDSSCLPTYLISEFARRYVTVALSGDGADELFGGYGRYFNILQLEQKLRSAEKAEHNWKPGNEYFNGGVAVFSEEALGELMGYVPGGTHQLLERLRKSVNDDPRPLLSRMRELDVRTYMPGAVLAKVDRMSMQHALEVRCPFLNIEIARFAEKLSPEQCYENGRGKLVLKELASRYIPREWLERPKQGFGLPISQWGREKLLRVTSDLCLGSGGMAAKWLGQANIKNFLSQQSDPERYSTYKIWHLLILESWLRSHRSARAASREDIMAGKTWPIQFDPPAVDPQRAAAPRDGKLHPANAALLSYLSDAESGGIGAGGVEIAAFAEDTIPQQIEQISNCRIVVCRQQPYYKCRAEIFQQHNWLLPEFWQESFPQIAAGLNPLAADAAVVPPDSKMAVICAPLSILPEEGLVALLQNGFGRIVSQDGSNWLVHRLQAPRNNLPAKIADKLRRAAAKIEFKARRAAARRFIHYFAKELPLYFKHDGGHCCRSRVPKLGRHAGRIEQQPEDLLIFEGETLLLSGYPVNDVRAFGGGRCSFEGSDVVFSSIDGSYPGDNKRRYSYFYRPLLLAAARFVGLAPQYLFFNLERDSRPAALREINSKVRLTEEQTLRPLNNPFENFIEDSAARRLCPQPAADSGEILLHTGYLYAGGAERQLCYLAARLKQRGFPVRVLTYFDCDINSFHYYPLLKQAGVPLDLLHRGEAHPDFDLAPLVNRHGLEVLSWINMLPREVADEVWSLFTELVVRKPKVLHCWLDQPNITGAIAGWLAGVPTVVLSTRNVNPTNFTYLDIPWYRQWYRILTRFPNVVLSGNSQAGIESYAGWIGIDADRFSLIHNGLNLEVISDPDPAQVERFRSQHRLSLSTPVIAGIFRISEEKRPLLFLQVVRELRRSFPDLRVFVAGIGPLEQQFTAEIARLGLENTVSFLGRREDVPVIISASSLLLLVSKVEGLPNVLMEAQYLRRPVVCTKAGGSGEIVVDGQTGCVAELDDFNGVVSRCSELLSNPEKRGKMGQAARKHIEENFSLDKMTSKSVQLYGLAAAEGEPGNEEKVNGPKSVSDPAGRYVGNLYR